MVFVLQYTVHSQLAPKGNNQIALNRSITHNIYFLTALVFTFFHQVLEIHHALKLIKSVTVICKCKIFPIGLLQQQIDFLLSVRHL